ncbi:MAG: sigma-70 family RNA polymerase sigma factor [Anaerolineae bacterium]|nr:MAG: sigma-70 family RNA polymerase sigma factor [Anaerolineae bacterium]
MDEDTLISLAQQGDLDAFNQLVLAYQDLAYHCAYRIMGESDAAEDATQDAFISAFRKLDSFRGGSFRAWLLRIVTNRCYDVLRYRRRRPIANLNPTDQHGEEIESPPWLADSGESPEERATRMELNQAIQHCLQDLPPVFRTVAVLVDVQGMDYEEAAHIIGKPLGTVKSRLSRARARLRNCLQQFWELLPDAFRLEAESVS